MHPKTLRIALLIVALTAQTACKRDPASSKASAPPVADRTIAAAPATAPTLVAAVTMPTAATPSTAEPRMDASIALHVAPKGQDQFRLPKAGEPSVLRITPITRSGEPVRDLETVLGARLTLVALRADRGWVEVIRATDLSAPTRATHEFEITFPTSGSHVLYVVFKPKGYQLTAVPAFITVDGPPVVDIPRQDKVLRWLAADGVQAELLLSPLGPTACQPTGLTSIWTRRGAPASLAADQTGSQVAYLAIDADQGSVAAGAGTPTSAVLTFPRPGAWRVFALAAPGDRKASPWTAHFAVMVGGIVPPEGCAPSTARP